MGFHFGGGGAAELGFGLFPEFSNALGYDGSGGFVGQPGLVLLKRPVQFTLGGQVFEGVVVTSCERRSSGRSAASAFAVRHFRQTEVHARELFSALPLMQEILFEVLLGGLRRSRIRLLAPNAAHDRPEQCATFRRGGLS